MRRLVNRPWTWITGWELWAVRRPVLTYVIMVDAAAVIAAAATVPYLPVGREDWIRFGTLAGCALVYITVSRTVERVREVRSGTAPYLDTKSVWSFAAVLVLPPALASAMVVLTYTWSWVWIWRSPRRRPLYRWVTSCATVLLATQAAVVVLEFGPGPYPGVPDTVAGLAVVLAAGALRWLVNYALIAAAILLSSPKMRASAIFQGLDERVLEAGAFGLGLTAGALVMTNPLILSAVVISLVAMHRGVLLPQLRRKASTDSKTGLNNVEWWHELAQLEFDRVLSRGGSLGMLMLDLDYFKPLNDAHGHLAGDKVLRAVADAISSAVRAYDIPGRWGGEEFVVLAPGADATGLHALAERIRGEISDLRIRVAGKSGAVVVDGLTVSVGAATYPAPDITTLDELLHAADGALYQAKDQGRDQVHILSVGSTEQNVSHPETTGR